MRNHLDFREKCGYETVSVTFHPDDNTLAPFDLEIYLAATDNPHFLGEAPVDEIAEQIAKCVGPSGKNCHQSMRRMKLPLRPRAVQARALSTVAKQNALQYT